MQFNKKIKVNVKKKIPEQNVKNVNKVRNEPSTCMAPVIGLKLTCLSGPVLHKQEACLFLSVLSCAITVGMGLAGLQGLPSPWMWENLSQDEQSFLYNHRRPVNHGVLLLCGTAFCACVI